RTDEEKILLCIEVWRIERRYLDELAGMGAPAVDLLLGRLSGDDEAEKELARDTLIALCRRDPEALIGMIDQALSKGDNGKVGMLESIAQEAAPDRLSGYKAERVRRSLRVRPEGSPAEGGISGSVRTLKGTNSFERHIAAQILLGRGWTPRTDEEKILLCIEVWRIERRYLDELAGMGAPAVDLLLGRLSSDDQAETELARDTLIALCRRDPEAFIGELAGMGEPAADLLLGRLSSDDQAETELAKDTLIALCRRDPEAFIGMLDRALNEGDTEKVSMLESITQEAAPDRLREYKIAMARKYFGPKWKTWALLALAGFGVALILAVIYYAIVSRRISKYPLPLLKGLADLQAGESGTRICAARDLGGMSDKRAIKPLIRALRDNNVNVVLAAVLALGDIGPKAKKAIRPLRKLEEHSDPEVREEVAETLKKISTEDRSGPSGIISVSPIIGIPVTLGFIYWLIKGAGASSQGAAFAGMSFFGLPPSVIAVLFIGFLVIAGVQHLTSGQQAREFTLEEGEERLLERVRAENQFISLLGKELPEEFEGVTPIPEEFARECWHSMFKDDPRVHHGAGLYKEIFDTWQLFNSAKEAIEIGEDIFYIVLNDRNRSTRKHGNCTQIIVATPKGEGEGLENRISEKTRKLGLETIERFDMIYKDVAISLCQLQTSAEVHEPLTDAQISSLLRTFREDADFETKELIEENVKFRGALEEGEKV
ncbi:MAG: HEAT repeat domain-containing protein, partial [Candidatus Omnitrophota bacterium]